MSKVDYKKLRPDILEKLLCDRMLDYKDNRTDMIRQLELDDVKKQIRSTEVNKWGDLFMIGYDSSNSDMSVQIGKLVEKGTAYFSHYSFGRLFYISKTNII